MKRIVTKLLELKSSNKISYRVFFWFFIPVFIIAIVVKFLQDLNIAQAIKSLKKTEMEDIDLQKEQKAAERKARELKIKADLHGHHADEHEKEAEKADVDENWHKE